MPLSAIRPVEAFPVELDKETMYCLRDPEGFVEEEIYLTPVAFFIASQLDGINDVADIQRAFAQYAPGSNLDAEDVHKVVEILDQKCILDNNRFEDLRNQIDTEYTLSDTRPAHLSGKAYPDKAAELNIFLNEMFTAERGPGSLPASNTSGTGDSLRCLIAPHIDFHRGGHSYAHGYLRMAGHGKPDVVFIFGVAHMAPPVPFILTRKHFDTPMGRVETDNEMVSLLANSCSDWDPFAFEMTHRTEHSIEFQVIMLAHLFGTDFKIVPILCASFHPGEDESSEDLPASVEHFLDVCAGAIADSPGRVSVIAGADLAHVGQRFGDSFAVDETIIESVRKRDGEDLDFVLKASPREFYRSVMKDGNERRVCGLNCIYAAMRSSLSGSAKGEKLHYDYAHDPAGGIVSFVNIVFP